MRLDTSFLVGVWLEAVVYGVYVVAFLVCLRLFRTHAPVVGRALPIWLGALFVLATAHCALSLSAALDAFVRYTELRGPRPTPYPSPSPTPGVRPQTQIPPASNPTHTPGPYGFHDPTRYISNRALPTNLASLGVYTGVVFLSSLMLLYRLLVMYRYKFIWIVGPGLLVIGSFIISIIVVWKYAHIDLNLPGAALQAQLEAIDPWVPPVYAIAFLSNLSISALMMVKTSFRSKVKVTPAFRRSHQHNVSGDYIFDIDERTGPIPSPVPRRNTISSRWVIIAGLVESGTLAPVFMLIALILCVAQGGEPTLLVPMLAPIAALAPTMQIIQLQLGLDSTARTRPSSVHDRPVGRSPYLVPAPRYQDSSDESDVEGGKRRSVSHSRTPSNSTNSRSRSGSSGNRPTDGRRFSARGMWAWRGHSNSNSQSSSSAREAPAVMVQMREMTGSAERTTKPDDDVWERIKLDEKPPERPAPSPDRLDESAANRNSDPPPLNRRNTLRKSGGIVKNMISKPTPIAADFPPTTATLPSTVLPNFTIDTETGVTPNLATGTGAATGEGLARARTLSEHKYHYRVRPREKTASSLAAYLSAQALEQSHPDGRGASASVPPTGQVHQQSTGPHQLSSGQGHQPSQGQHPQSGQPSHQGQQQMTFPMPPSMNYQPASSSGHLPPTIVSTVPTSPASGFTSLNPASRNPFRYDPSTPYSDLQREAPSDTNMLGIGLSGAQRTPLTVPYTLDSDLVPRWGAVPGAPRIVGLDTFFPPSRGRGWSDGTSQRDVSPAPGLQQDYARAREEVLRQMQRERGAMSDDESVYSSQVLNRR